MTLKLGALPSPSMPRLLIAASGTGGHLFPALAVADQMPPDWSVRWLGVPDRLERQLVPSRYPLYTVRAGGLQGRGLRKLQQLLKLLWSTVPVLRLIQREDCCAVFTTGGYIAAPAILAARLARKPVVLHESNAVPGQVTRLLGRFCTLVALGLPQAASHLPAARPRVTGTPVRREFLQPAPCPGWVPPGDGPLVLVIGGSQGALGLNRMVRAAAPRLLARGCRIVHLCGNQDPDQGQLQHHAYVERSFSDEIPGLLQHADLAISRAGAGSLSELAVCGTPAVLVPFPQAADDHQRANAEAARAEGAAVIVAQHAADDTTLSAVLNTLLEPRLNHGAPADDPLVPLAAGMERLAVRDADRVLARLMQELTA